MLILFLHGHEKFFYLDNVGGSVACNISKAVTTFPKNGVGRALAILKSYKITFIFSKYLADNMIGE
jgi:hypothetical protein